MLKYGLVLMLMLAFNAGNAADSVSERTGAYVETLELRNNSLTEVVARGKCASCNTGNYIFHTDEDTALWMFLGNNKICTMHPFCHQREYVKIFWIEYICDTCSSAQSGYPQMREKSEWRHHGMS